MSRMYSVVFENVALAAAQDLWEIQPGDDKPIILHSIVIAGCNLETSEQLRFTIKRVTTSFASGSGGTTPSAIALDTADAAAGVTTPEVNNTSRATGTAATLWAEGANLVPGWIYLPPPEDRIKFRQTEVLIVGLEAAPSASTVCSGTLVFEEL